MGKIIREYLSKDDVDYIRLRWFYRRLAQVGHPGAIDVSLENLDSLGPCFANICFYISSIQSIEPERWKDIGGKLLLLLEADEVKIMSFLGFQYLAFSHEMNLLTIFLIWQRFLACQTHLPEEK